MRQYRTPTAVVLGVLALLTTIVLATPSGATEAGWSATGHVEVPAMAVGEVSFEIAQAGNAATVTNTSGFGVRYRPVDVSLVDPATGPVIPPAGTSFTYHPGTDCTVPARWTAIASGEAIVPVVAAGQPQASLPRGVPAQLCLVVSTDGAAEEALRLLDGRQLQAVTRLEAASLDGGSWTAQRTWTMPFTMDLPDLPEVPLPPEAQDPPEEPPAPEPSPQAQCRPDGRGTVLSWPWTGSDTTAWDLLRRPQQAGGDWVTVRSVAGDAAGTMRLTVDDLPVVNRGPSDDIHEFAVRAHSPAGTADVEQLPVVWTLKSPGNSGKLECLEVQQ